MFENEVPWLWGDLIGALTGGLQVRALPVEQ
jgi:hypothetical protein